MILHVLGCSHHNAPVKFRELLAFSPAQAEQALGKLRERFPRTEAVLISTCNRVELYTAVESVEEAPSHIQLVEFLADFHGLHVDEVFADLFDHTGEDAVRHLFLVAASLDSMVLGEAQILSQVKQAYEMAKQCNSTGPLTHAIFQRALKAARRVTTETLINQKRVSIPSVAVGDFAKMIFERFDDKKVLVIGAGEMGGETIRYLLDEGAKQITVVNRSLERAEKLAAEWQATASSWDQLDELLAHADLVVSTTGSTDPIMTLDRFRPIHLQRRHQHPLCILDLAIPRDFDPEIGTQLQDIYLYSIDDLREVCEANEAERRKELDGAVRIIEEETREFMADLNHRATSPIIRRLKQDWERPKDDELARLFNKLPQLDERTRDEIRRSFDRLINKLLHPPLESLRTESRDGVPHGLLDALKRLFQIKD